MARSNPGITPERVREREIERERERERKREEEREKMTRGKECIPKMDVCLFFPPLSLSLTLRHTHIRRMYKQYLWRNQAHMYKHVYTQKCKNTTSRIIHTEMH